MFPLPFDPFQAFSAAAMNVGQQMGLPTGSPRPGPGMPGVPAGAVPIAPAGRLRREDVVRTRAGKPVDAKADPSKPADAKPADAKPSEKAGEPDPKASPIRAAAETGARAVAFGGAAFAAFGLLRKLV